jgi:hypothetical protein
VEIPLKQCHAKALVQVATTLNGKVPLQITTTATTTPVVPLPLSKAVMAGAQLEPHPLLHLKVAPMIWMALDALIAANQETMS